MTLILRQLFLFLGSFVSGEKTAKTEMTSPAKKPRTESSSKGLESSQYDIFFVTGNSQKLLEVNSFFQQNGVTIAVENVRLDLPEMQGECEEIGLEKIKTAFAHLQSQRASAPEKAHRPFLVFVEDTSLLFHAMNGLPGPYIKWFLDKLGHDGLYRMLNGWGDKSATAQTIFAVMGNVPLPQDDGVVPVVGPSDSESNVWAKTFVGQTLGKIVPPRGSGAVGNGPKKTLIWNPVFEVSGAELLPGMQNGLTYAEMDQEEMVRISQRSKALRKMMAFLKTLEGGAGAGAAGRQ